MPVCSGESAVIPCACCGGLFFKSALECEGFSFVRCVLCGLVQRNPQPVKDKIITRYSTTFGNDYLSYELENEETFLKLQQLALIDAGFYRLERTLFEQGQSGRGMQPSVLDIGCATGALLAFLRNRKWRVMGVEISPCAGFAREERGLDVRNIPLEDNKFPEGSFDVIHASHLIEHLNDPRSFLAETFRILKNTGSIFIATPNISGFQARLFGSRWRSAIFDHLYLFSKRTLTRMLKDTGFKIESCRTWGGLAAGTAPLWLKRTADFTAKQFGLGDVMIIQARKKNGLW